MVVEDIVEVIVDTAVIDKKVEELRQNSAVSKLLDQLGEVGAPLIVGGAVRDWFVGKDFRDLDIIVDCPKLDLWFLYQYKAIKNKFGGFKLNVGDVDFDIWSLESTWALQNDATFEKKLITFPQTVFLNIDAVAYRLDTKEIYQNGFFQAVEDKVIDIVYEPNPFPNLCVSKSLCAFYKYDWTPSDRLRVFINKQLDLGYDQKIFDRHQRLNKTNYNYDECIKRI